MSNTSLTQHRDGEDPPVPSGETATMDAMAKHAYPETPAPRRDHLWVLFIIAGCALLEVWASWVLIGGMSGFPKIGGPHGLPTAWTLAVTSEAYWGYALYSWLAGAPGPRSRTFAMWSFVGVFLLSLVGQGASHLVPPGTKPSAALVVFVTSLPVLVLALIAILIHLRQRDREEAAEEAEENSLMTELEAERSARKSAEAGLESARSELAEAAAKAEVLTRKLTATSGRKQTRKRTATSARKSAPTSGGSNAELPPGSGGGSGNQLPAEADVLEPAEADLSIEDEARILALTAEGYTETDARILTLIEKGHSPSKAGVLAGKSDSHGRQVWRQAQARQEDPSGTDRA